MALDDQFMTVLADDFIAQPTEAQGYLIAAQGMLAGARPLGEILPIPNFALTLLCGHACEAALKSLLAYNGIIARTLSRRPYGHDLLKLWDETERSGFNLINPRPDWISQLNRVYDNPFHLRYPLGFHAIVLPDQKAMLEGTRILVSFAESIIR
ncbi:hypothetical protein [Undibacterium flavidum]|uniref:HEPN domain-containing protein n=1 Tax=Undibacterium flavidum TaxID=2762297 RepID=A0ABR6YFM7_9BURK|nr:hypothetical protein [Undibacterium flavidum]MBC3875371.1 hypothetical protein [Undibacterium flavidum]